MDSSDITRVLVGCSHWVQYRRCEPGKYREQLSVVCKCSSDGPMTTSFDLSPLVEPHRMGGHGAERSKYSMPTRE